jgi:hypothetical protein
MTPTINDRRPLCIRFPSEALAPRVVHPARRSESAGAFNKTWLANVAREPLPKTYELANTCSVTGADDFFVEASHQLLVGCDTHDGLPKSSEAATLQAEPINDALVHGPHGVLAFYRWPAGDEVGDVGVKVLREAISVLMVVGIHDTRVDLPDGQPVLAPNTSCQDWKRGSGGDGKKDGPLRHRSPHQRTV